MSVPRRPQSYGAGRGEIAVVIDCSDLDRAAGFWAAVLGYVRDGEATGSYLSLAPADGAGIDVLLQQVPETKTRKNRLHLDLRTRNLEAEVSRITALGATCRTTEPVLESGWAWHVLSDPDGNEFCVLRPPPGYWRR
jgi:predicted enzyme related to lactoylglutathione lyase